MGKNLRSMQSEEVFQRFFDEIGDMIWISTPQGKLLDVNHAGIKLLGFSSKSEFLTVDHIKNLYHNPKNYHTWKKLMEETGYARDFEATLVKKKGEIIATLGTTCQIKNNKGNVIAYAGIIRDITKNVRSEMNVHRMNVELIDSLMNVKKTQPKLIQQEKLASIGQLAAGIAHELNNPIGFISSNFTSLLSYVEIIKRYIEQCKRIINRLVEGNGKSIREMAVQTQMYKEKQKLDYILGDIEDLVTESMEGIQRITEIVTSLRNFSRIDNESRIEQYDVNEALDSTLIVAKNEIKYIAEIKKDFSQIPLIECIGGELNQVFLNVIVNAAQAIKSQNRADKGIITIKTFDDGKDVYCEISDDGPGIPKKILNRIFDPFFTTKEAGEGIGLGLNISYDIIVNKHGGDLSVESETGKGTKFIMKLPIKSKIKDRELNSAVSK